ncbi:family 16 glycosylhydrolase [Candidatus Mycosynbacter amalyticus]|uniref:Family 16 glycosylhydrolase n=1 Tax=Candidatus Mycosynbacter amalyticus TaxID=2665156 RepID=A0A857MM77_9BACT|nr:glycoside hydrolase family 16 protein [Candidatus Mycosynbacter amalyticus]QHN42379.1 family 16 glycosylhydrolase [Candidatus Mycosynbacter amalyticus]
MHLFHPNSPQIATIRHTGILFVRAHQRAVLVLLTLGMSSTIISGALIARAHFEAATEREVHDGSTGTIPADTPTSPQSISSSTGPTTTTGTSATASGSTDNTSPASSAPGGTAGSSVITGTSLKSPAASSGNSSNGGVAPSTPSPDTPVTPACASGYSGIYPNCLPLPVGIGGSWSLIMRDEFDGSSLASQWATQRGPSYSYGDPYNASIEDAYYVANNPKVQNGSLVLTLNQGATNGYPYSSGMVQNGRSWSYKYGYIEARIKVPGNTGVWPAFWTLPAPVDSTWPPEIDIFEFGLSSQTRPSFNYHYGTSSNHQQSGLTVYGNSGTDYTQDFHTYGMLWTANKIQVYLDGQPGPSYTNAANITSISQYIIFNLALKKGYTVPSGTAMYVDYVRVWQ